MGTILDLRPRLRAARCRHALTELRAISLHLAEKHIRETELEITRQRVILNDRLETGRSLDRIDEILNRLERLLHERRTHLTRLEREQG